MILIMNLVDEMFEPVAERLRVLADATRLRILDMLRRGEASVLEIAAQVGTSQPNVSRHLALLLRAGIVGRRQEGRHVHYRVLDPFVDRICDAICGSLHAHVERQAQRLPAAANGSGGGAPMTSTRSTPGRRRT
jgi:DNA-binding transcriptional ArsR family regulator